MAAAWPATLPTGFLTGFTGRQRAAIVRSEMDVGLPKLRRRATYAWDELDGELFCTRAQVEALRLFYRETLAGGTQRFVLNSPIDLRTYEGRFREPPEVSFVGGNYFRARLSLDLFETGSLRVQAFWPDGTPITWPDGTEAFWP